MIPMEMKPLRNTAALPKSLILIRQPLAILALFSVAFFQACSSTRTNPSTPVALKPFESDGCSCVPDGPHADPDRWLPACEEHDRTYWAGGSHHDRLNADRKLKAAIKKCGHPLTAEIYFIGTRFGGSPYLPTPWRWGFGRPWPSGYKNPHESTNPDS